MSDLIKREDAIKEISELVTSMSVCVSVDECHGRKGVFIPDITVEMFRNASLEGVEDLMVSGEMEDISLPSAQQWIPLSERWPDDDGVYLVTYKGVTNVALFAWGGWTIGTEDGMGQALPDAWMPLPGPYKGKADGPIR